MMREIKFRAWDIDKKEYISDFDISDNGIVWTQKHIDYDPEYPNVIVEQYTGLKDKNGKEIYEGDIIRNIEEIAPNKSKTYQVFYKVDFAKFDVAPIDGKIDILSGGFNFASMAHYEIIGNIHENPELLEEE